MLFSPAALDTPYLGQWLPGTARASASLIASRTLTHDELTSDPRRQAPAATATPSIESRATQPALRVASAGSALPGTASGAIVLAHPDSGCTGSLTPHRSALCNVRPCAESFRAADGATTSATCIGDMPVIARDRSGQLRSLTLRNVRCVPGYAYTLLSVRQMWAEQRISAQFDNTNALVLSTPAGAVHLPFAASQRLPTVMLVSTAPLARAATPPAKAPPRASSAALTADPEPATAPAKPSHASSRTLGFHRIGASAHVAKLPAAQAAELMHRRSHAGVVKLRATAHTSVDAPKVLASAPATTGNDSVADALARIKRAPHSGTLTAPDPEPGELHVDLKELVLSRDGYRYVVFAIDAYSRYVFVDFIKLKSEAAEAIRRIRAAFIATVGVRLDSEGKPLPRPDPRVIQSDREGKLMSHFFKSFCADSVLHHTTSPPHDHDLNPIAERIIGLIAENSTALLYASGLPVRLWPWIIAYAVDWHNSTVCSVGSSPADANITPHQRFTHRPPRVMDLMSLGARAAVLKPPQHQHKPSLSTRGWLGVFLGRSRYSKG
jgi:hypothetical protein